MTRRQKQVLDFVREQTEKTGTCPSFQEIMEAIGLKSKSGVHRLIEALVGSGHMIRHRGLARTLLVLDAKNPHIPAAFQQGYDQGFGAGYRAGLNDRRAA